MNTLELTGNHIGAWVTVTIGNTTVTDTLVGVRHEVDQITDFQLNGQVSVSLGRRRTILTFLKAGDVRCPDTSMVEIHDPLHAGSR